MPYQRVAGLRLTRPTRRHLQIALGLLWLLDAVLQCQPAMFRPDFYGMMLMMNRTAPPGWLWNWITDIEPTVLAHTTAVNTVAVVVQFAVGLGLLWRPTVRPALALSIPWAVTVWLFGEMAGGLFVEGGSALTGAPGAALVYAALAVVLWPRRPDDAPSPAGAGGWGPGHGFPAVDGAPDTGRAIAATGHRTAADAGHRTAADADHRTAAADHGLLPPAAARLLWVALWVGTAALEGGYLNRSPDYAAQAMDTAAIAGPSWLHAAGQGVGGLVGTNGALFAACAGVVQAAIGLGIVFPRFRRAALVAGMLLALFYAVVGQAFGGIFSSGVLHIMSSGATDPGAGPVVILLALALWPGRPPGQRLGRPHPAQDDFEVEEAERVELSRR